MLEINSQRITQKIVNFLRKETKKAGFEKVIVALSGGVDSSTAAFLAVKALGAENVLVAKLPHKDFSHDGDADLIISQLKIPKTNVFEIEISEIVKKFLSNLGDLSDLRVGNLMARIRMVILYDLAKASDALVCGTENKSEYLLGYFTRFGDEASDLEPTRNLYKTQVIELAKFLSVPGKIIKKPAVAGLWKDQTDEKELGFSYLEGDPILSLHFDQKESWGKIMKQGFDQDLVKKVKNQVEKNKFKHEVPRVC